MKVLIFSGTLFEAAVDFKLTPGNTFFIHMEEGKDNIGREVMRAREAENYSYSGVNTRLIDNLKKCSAACEVAVSFSSDNEALDRCKKLARDCADTCSHVAVLFERRSAIADGALIICEEICFLCAQELRKHPFDKLQYCAKTCIQCMQFCHSKNGYVETGE